MASLQYPKHRTRRCLAFSKFERHGGVVIGEGSGLSPSGPAHVGGWLDITEAVPPAVRRRSRQPSREPSAQ